MTRREFLIRLRGAAFGLVLGLVGAALLPIGMAVWLWTEAEDG